VADIGKIDMIQRRAARFVMKDYSRESSVTGMLKTLEWDTLEDRRKKACLTMMYKIQQLIGIDRDRYLTRTSEKRTRSSRQTKFTRGTATKNVYKYSFFPRTETSSRKSAHQQCSSPTILHFKSTL
jgi:hypothetical protein